MILRSPQIIDFPKENQCFLRCEPGNGVTGADLHLRRGGLAPPPGQRGHFFAEIQISAGEVQIPVDFGRIP